MIDYVIISSDDNPMYKDFYPIVAKRWKDIGFKTYYINITNENDLTENEYGFIHKMKSLDFISTGFQSQVVRLFSSNFVEGNLLMSDIDMLPINGNYYNRYNDELTDENVIIYSGQPYGDVPYYPMCYVLSNSKNYRRYLGIEDLSFEDYCKMLLSNYKEAWNTDENFMYDKFQNYSDKIMVKTRDLSRRVDRGNWRYDPSLLKTGYYIDSHMLRPYGSHKNLIDEIVRCLK